MTTETKPSAAGLSLAARLEHEGSIRAADCYQCGKCSAGCPAAGEMDHPPSRLVRLLQLELARHEQAILASRAIWMCLGCETCLTRCPQEFDLPRAMDFLRHEALARGVAHRDAAEILAFHRAFLRSIESHGRLHEFGMIVEYKLRTGRLFQDLALAPAMFLRGKIALLPHGMREAAPVARIFERARAEERKNGPDETAPPRGGSGARS